MRGRHDGNRRHRRGFWRRSFDRRRQIDDISSVSGADLVIDKSGTKTVIDVQYSRTVPLVANVSLLFDLHPSSDTR